MLIKPAEYRYSPNCLYKLFLYTLRKRCLCAEPAYYTGQYREIEDPLQDVYLQKQASLESSKNSFLAIEISYSVYQDAFSKLHNLDDFHCEASASQNKKDVFARKWGMQAIFIHRFCDVNKQLESQFVIMPVFGASLV